MSPVPVGLSDYMKKKKYYYNSDAARNSYYEFLFTTNKAFFGVILRTLSWMHIFVRVRKSVTIKDTLAGIDEKDIIKLRKEVDTTTTQGM